MSKSCAMCACMPTWSTCHTGCQLLITCQCANKRANVLYGVLMFQSGVPMCKRYANFSTGHANVPKVFILYLITVIHIICICIVQKTSFLCFISY